MGSDQWIAFAALITTIAFGGGGVIWKLGDNKTKIIEKMGTDKNEIHSELEAIRLASFMEYKEIRAEVATLIAKAYRELGEAPKGLREHVNSMELWMRDNLLPRKEYERDQDQILKSIERLTETMDKRFNSLEKQLREPRG